MKLFEYVTKVVKNIKELTKKDLNVQEPNGTTISFRLLEEQLSEAYTEGYNQCRIDYENK